MSVANSSVLPNHGILVDDVIELCKAVYHIEDNVPTADFHSILNGSRSIMHTFIKMSI